MTGCSQVGQVSTSAPGNASNIKRTLFPGRIKPIAREGMGSSCAALMGTRNSALSLNMDDRAGRLTAGMGAEILFLEADPSLDIRALTQNVAVAENGHPSIINLRSPRSGGCCFWGPVTTPAMPPGIRTLQFALDLCEFVFPRRKGLALCAIGSQREIADHHMMHKMVVRIPKTG